MSPELLLTIGMFGSLIISIMLGVSLAFALGAIGTITALIMWGPAGLMPIVTGVFNYMWMLLLAAVPLFVFIGVALSKSTIATDMYEAFYLWSGRLRGGLAVGTCGFAAALSAMTGNCSASTVTTGLVAIPPMRKRKYDEGIIFGSIGSAGTMGILIPPSITLIVIGMMTGQSIGKLFAGGLVAGTLIVAAFILYILARAYLQPGLCPAMEETATLAEKARALKSVTLPILIILSILGSLFFGIATPTEASSVGAVAVLICVIIRGECNLQFIKEVSYQTASITGMILWIMFGAAGFVSIYSGGGGIYFVQSTLMGLDVSPLAMIITLQLTVLVLGMFLDPMGIILLCLPIFYPVVQNLGFDPIWYGVIFNIALCIGYITPPFGYNLFYLKSLSPATDMVTIFKSVVPFITIMVMALLLMMIFPSIILWLPHIMVPG
ncbi:TRAP transporter large permease [Desulfotignum phosphitoxidans]|uniref:TRAP-type C4-dicarboxylate permease, large subunit DctM n=1 Tax=Desulfotignum phosphitoxidans DSM 13687 TaxID=1286635 RepID=S0G0M2_9BACT|nr:TRAP transporter large permease subunit [Desulfotignum phosphitoxidans]EMS80938.1 TRAP-type C4-dicarboxylate permease, large subunit DctM [Desulfotignum phosphitoxidans DSM 13687]